jgi:serine/threonine protein phosphatase PrpC
MGIGMTPGGWRYVAASVVGTSHEKLGGNCQDANDCQVHLLPNGEKVLVAAVADGAGSTSRGGDGAAKACSTFMKLANDYLNSGNSVEQISLETAQSWIHEIQNALGQEAESASLDPQEFACTLLGFVAGQSCTACLQIGDGVIVVADAEERTYGHVFWPDRGEYANTTHFVTEDQAVEHLQFAAVQRQIVEAALLTDGLQSVALDYQQHAAHAPFFRGLFAPLQTTGEGRCDELSRFLRDFLSSHRVNEKTDDDKTLVLASRVNGSLSAPA